MSGVARSLVEWLTGHGRGCSNRAAWDALIAESIAQSVAPQLFHALKRGSARGVDVPTEVIQCAWIAALQQSRDVAGFRSELEEVLKVLDAANVSAILMKGAHLANFVYPQPSLRPMRDFDLLFARHQVADAEAALVTAGYSGARDRPVDDYFARLHELPELRAEGRLPIELHWNLVPPFRTIMIDMAGIFARSVPSAIGAAPVRLMAREDLLLHVCIHAASEDHFGLKGLRPLLDIQAVLSDPLDWQTVNNRAREWGAERSVALSLALARRVLGVELPEAIDALFTSSIPRRVLTAAEAQAIDRPGMRVEAPVTPTIIVHMLRHPGLVLRFLRGRHQSLAAPALGTGRRTRAMAGWTGALLARWIERDRGLLGALARRVARGFVIDRWLSSAGRR